MGLFSCSLALSIYFSALPKHSLTFPHGAEVKQRTEDEKWCHLPQWSGMFRDHGKIEKVELRLNEKLKRKTVDQLEIIDRIGIEDTSTQHSHTHTASQSTIIEAEVDAEANEWQKSEAKPSGNNDYTGNFSHFQNVNRIEKCISSSFHLYYIWFVLFLPFLYFWTIRNMIWCVCALKSAKH